MEPAEDSAPLPLPPAKPPGRVKVFACPQCGGAVTLRAVGHSVTAQCSHCSSLIDVANENYQVIAAAQQLSFGAAIALGTRGKLDGVEWEVVGFQDRCDETRSFVWTEYLLYNPYYGYRFLVDESGDWTLIRMLNRDVAGIGGSDSVQFEGQTYKRFSKGKSYTQRVGGEFYWRASTDDVADGVDYICPPFRLFAERTNDEIVVSHGYHLSASTVEAAFGLSLPAADTSYISASAPNPYAAAKEGLIPITLAALLGATMVQFAGVALSDNAQISNTSLSFASTDKEKSVTGPTFTLTHGGNLQVDTSSPLSNNWLELGLSLVNTETGQTYEATQGMEYYSGTDSDGDWSEGDNSSSVTFPRVPAGSYKLLIEPDAGAFTPDLAAAAAANANRTRITIGADGLPVFAPADDTPPAAPSVTATMRIRQGVMNWSNYLFALVLLILYPAYILARYWWFEASRWSNSGSGDSSSGSDDE